MEMWKKLIILLKDIRRKIPAILPVIPAIAVGGIAMAVLISYHAPAYEADAAESITIPEQEQETQTEGGFELEDGLYLGSGKGYGGDITAAVEIKSKRIENIWIISAEGEDTAFLNRAKKLIEDIILQQSPDVDVVSGATYSSKGILAAVKEALTGQQTIASFSSSSESGLEAEEYSNLKDGVYTGSAQGFGGTIKVQVSISGGKIADIQILEASGEGEAYLSKASVLIPEMLSSQSTNVDAVSGATYTSNGLIKAVRSALSQAAGSSDGEEAQQEDTTAGAVGRMPYPDGIYYGTGTGFAGKITVAIAISNQALKAAVITESSDDDQFLEKAKAILDKVVLKQTIDVDTVTGATYSSKGILEALQNALKEAKNAAGEQSGDVQEETDTEPDTQKQEETDTEPEVSGTYRDGTYSVAAVCTPDSSKAFAAYTLSFVVTIKDDKITAVTDVKGSGAAYISLNDSFISRAVNGTSSQTGVVSQITTKGNASGIDVVSGATCTSNAIIEGCVTALKNAKINPSSDGGTTETDKDTTEKETEQETEEETGQDSPEPSTEETESEKDTEVTGIYKDGTYTASAVCSPDEDEEFAAYNISLKVTVSGNKVTSITDIAGSGSGYISFDSYFIELAANGSGTKAGVISQIKGKQSAAGIDTVSGATCSSLAITEACRQALEAAK